ncbi:YccF domain-containing protein [Angustibacter sp. McL0619]|uniref:YccF domain-containing protein n=1 Tax=Angustibacter sp. McL0619 TaxID=3415676 RepID=UPI003CE9A388
MRTIGNILWFFLAGIWLAIGYAVAGVICFILIITIPFGIASFRLAGFVLWPFGRTVVRRPTSGAMSAIGNVIWFVVAGVWIAIEHVVVGLLLCVTIIGIPFGIASFKLAGLALFPLGKMVVPASSVATSEQLVTMP